MERIELSNNRSIRIFYRCIFIILILFRLFILLFIYTYTYTYTYTLILILIQRHRAPTRCSDKNSRRLVKTLFDLGVESLADRYHGVIANASRREQSDCHQVHHTGGCWYIYIYTYLFTHIYKIIDSAHACAHICTYICNLALFSILCSNSVFHLSYPISCCFIHILYIVHTHTVYIYLLVPH